jgi:prolipoprotein diacylglyceryltransferase
MQLPQPVYPTPFYETLTCLILFLVLWFLRKKMRPAGVLFALYLILNGLERFLIEKIRVNNKMDLFGMQPTQAEVLSFGLMIIGVLIWIYLYTKYRATQKSV